MRIQNRWLLPVTISATLWFALWLSTQAWPGLGVSAAAPAAPAPASLAATGILTPAWTADFRIANRAGDVDQDGYTDLVVAEFGAQSAALYTGSTAGLGAAPAATISVPFTAPQRNDAIIELSGAGDANGDGFSDMLIRSSRFICEIPAEFCGNLPVLLIYQGPSSGFAELTDIDVDPAFGSFSAAFAGSVNQDAYDDLLIGDLAGGVTPVVKVYYGSAAGIAGPAAVTLQPGPTDTGCGFDGEEAPIVAPAGDVNGDGYADVLVGQPGYDNGPDCSVGRVLVYLGSAAGLATSPAITLAGAAAGKEFGRTVAAVGDVNQDGFDDLLIGVMDHAVLYYGSATGVNTVDALTLTVSGYQSAGAAGDFNQDGFDDVVLGGENSIHLFLGSAGGLAATPAYSAAAENAGGGFGATVGPAGDVNHDGYGDFFVTAPNYGSSGRSYVFHGFPTTADHAPIFTSTPITQTATGLFYTYNFTATDQDVGGSLRFALVRAPEFLRLTDDGDGTGTVHGVPVNGDQGSYEVVLQAQDATGLTATQSYVLMAEYRNLAPPTALTDHFYVDEHSVDNPLDVLANDSEPEGAALAIQSVTGTRHGTARVSTDGLRLFYTPAPGYAGEDAFFYTISDGERTATARSTVSVIEVNDPPIAVDDHLPGLMNLSQELAVLDNDSDEENNYLQIAAWGVPAHGTLTATLGLDRLVYTPTTDFHGTDSFTYTVSDGTFSSSAWVTVTVYEVAAPPNPGQDTLQKQEDSADLLISAAALLANDTDPNGDTLSLVAVGQPSLGQTTFMTATGQIIYSVGADVFGRDSFTYTVSDGQFTATGQVIVEINGTPDPPQPQEDIFQVTINSRNNPLDVLKNDYDPDNDPLTVQAVSAPAHGSATTDGSVVYYTPASDYLGEDSFEYTWGDGQFSGVTQVTVQVATGNRTPAPVADSFTVNSDSSASPLAVLANDSDPDGDLLHIVQVSSSSAGAQISRNPAASALLYTPPSGFSGVDSFTYLASDGWLQRQATVQVTVTPRQADLAVSLTANRASLPAGESGGVSYELSVSNGGPGVAEGVTLAFDLPLPPQSYATRGAGCVAPSSGTGLTCTLGDLAPGAATTFVVQSAFAAPAGGTYATVATVSSGVNDPNPANNRAETTLTVSDARAQRQVGALLVSADSFSDQGGGVTRAAGNVTLGAHFYLPGPDAAVLLNADGMLSGQTGTLTLIAGDYALFRGGFAIDTAALGTPGADVDTSLLTQVAGFDASNGVISAFNLNTGWVTGTVTLALAAGDASGRAPLAFTVQPGPHFSGETNAPFTVDYGSGAVLRLSELTGRLAAAQGRYALQATGALTYNLFTKTDLFPGVTLSEYDTADYRGTLFDVAVDLWSDGTVQNRERINLVLGLDYVSLSLDQVTLDERGLLAAVGTWQLPLSQGGGIATTLAGVRIDPAGLNLSDRYVRLPDIRPEHGNFLVRQPTALLVQTAQGFHLSDVKGTLDLNLPQNDTRTADHQVGPPQLNALLPTGNQPGMVQAASLGGASDPFATFLINRQRKASRVSFWFKVKEEYIGTPEAEFPFLYLFLESDLPNANGAQTAIKMSVKNNGTLISDNGSAVDALMYNVPLRQWNHLLLENRGCWLQNDGVLCNVGLRINGVQNVSIPVRLRAKMDLASLSMTLQFFNDAYFDKGRYRQWSWRAAELSQPNRVKGDTSYLPVESYYSLVEESLGAHPGLVAEAFLDAPTLPSLKTAPWPQPVTYLSFDPKTTAGNARDRSCRSETGTVKVDNIPGCVANDNGKAGGYGTLTHFSLQFTSASDALTASFWYRLRAGVPAASIISAGASYVQYIQSPQPRLVVGGGGTKVEVPLSPSFRIVDFHHFILAEYPSVEGKRRTVLYLDGTVVADLIGNSAPFNFKVASLGGSVQADYDEFKLYDTVREVFDVSVTGAEVPAFAAAAAARANADRLRAEAIANGDVPISLANSQLILRNPRNDGEVIHVDGVKWILPAQLGGKTYELDNPMTIDEDGVTLPDFPAEFGLGGTDRSFAVTTNRATLKRVDKQYMIELEGTLTINLGLSVDPESVIGATVELTIKEKGISGRLPAFEFDLAGFRIAWEGGTVEGSTLKAESATLKVPDSLLPLNTGGVGLGATLYGVTITPNQRKPDLVSVTGGAFSFGPLQISKISLGELKGVFKKLTNGYEMGASAQVGFPGLASKGGDNCSIIGAITFGVDNSGRQVVNLLVADQNAVLTVEPVAGGSAVTIPLAANAAGALVANPTGPHTFEQTLLNASAARKVRVKNARLGLDGCELPLGNTGAYLTKVIGSVVLEGATQVFKIDVGMAFGPALATIGRPVEADLYAQLGLNYPYFAPVIERHYYDTRERPFSDTQTKDGATQPTGFERNFVNPWGVIPIPVDAPDGQFGRIDELEWRNQNGLAVQIQPASNSAGPFLYTDEAGGRQLWPPQPAIRTVKLPAEVSSGQGGTMFRLDWGATTVETPVYYKGMPFTSHWIISPTFRAVCEQNWGWRGRLFPEWDDNWDRTRYCFYDKATLTIQDVYRLQRWKNDFTFVMGGAATAFKFVELGRANMTVDSQIGFNASLLSHHPPFPLSKFSAEVDGWQDSRGVNLTGKADTKVGVTLKQVWNKLPNEGLTLDVGAEFGKFNPAEWGAKAKVEYDIPGWIDWAPGIPDTIDIKLFAGFGNGKVSLAFGSGTDKYQLVTRNRVALAALGQSTLQASTVAGGNTLTLAANLTPLAGTAILPVDNDIHFAPLSATGAGNLVLAATQAGSSAAADDVLVDVDVPRGTDMDVTLETWGNGPSMELVAPNGMVYTPDVLPEGISYNVWSEPVAAYGASPAGANARVRILQTVDGITVDATLDGNLTVASELAFATASPYVTVAPGSHSLSVRRGGEFANLALNLAAGDEITVIVVGTAGNPQTWLLQDDNRQRGDGWAEVRFIHAAPGAGEVTVRELFGQDRFVGHQYLTQGDYTELFPQPYNFAVHNTAGNALLLVERFVPIEEKSSYTLVLAQDAAGQLRLVTVEDAGPAMQIHAVNAGSAPLNLAINGAAAWNGLTANTVGEARSFALSHGTLTAQGDGGLAATLPLTTAHDLTLAAYQQGGQPALALFTSMNTFAGAEKVALRVAHLADSAPALDVTVNDFLLADDLTLGHAGPYALRTYRAFCTVVVKDGAGTVLKTFDNVMIPEGAAATLYVTGQGSDLALLVGVDSPAMRRTIATYRIQAAHVQVGTWQVLLRNALTGQDYELEVRGKQIEPVLSDPQLSYDASHATIRWAYVGKEQNSVVDIRLTEITGPLTDTVVAQYPQTVEVLNGQGISETVTVTVTELAVPQRGTIRTQAVLTSTVRDWIDGTPQQHIFDYSQLPSGQYEVQVVVDDLDGPPLQKAAPQILVVNHTWPASWTSNLQISAGEFRRLGFDWTAGPNADTKDYEIWIEGGLITGTLVITEPAYVTEATLFPLTVGDSYRARVVAVRRNTGERSFSEWVTSAAVTGADFALAAVNAPTEVSANSVARFDVRLTTALDPYPGAVMLLAGGADALGVSVEPGEIVPTAAGVTATVAVSASEWMRSGPVTVTVTGAGGGVLKMLTIPIMVKGAEYNLTPERARLAVGPGGATLAVSTQGRNGHNRLITLDTLALPYGIQAAFDQEQILAGAGTNLRLAATPALVSGVYTMTLRGDDGLTVIGLPIVLEVALPDFQLFVTLTETIRSAEGLSIDVLTNTLTISRNQTVWAPLDVRLLGGWDQPVTLAVDPGAAPPFGQVGFELQQGILAEPANDHITVNGDATVLLRVSTGVATPSGRYLLPVTATSGGQARQIELPVYVTTAAGGGHTLLAQTMCYGTNLRLSIDVQPGATEVINFSLVVITGPVPPNLSLSGDMVCVPYTGLRSMVELTNQLVTQECPDGVACNTVNRIIFAPDSSYRIERIQAVETVTDLFLPVVLQACSEDPFCPQNAN